MAAPDTQTLPEATRRQILIMSRDKPALKPLLQTFGQIQTAMAACRAHIQPPDVSGIELDIDRLRQGTPLLEQLSSLEIDIRLKETAAMLLPVLAESFPALADAAGTLGKALEHEKAVRACTALITNGNDEDLDCLADSLGMDAAELGFLLNWLGKPALEAVAAALAPLLEEVPWNFWDKGYCPVCGGTPSMSMLKQGEQEPTEYLKNSSAQRWLCCPSCAHTWRFRRTVCPSCGHDEQENREYYHVEGQTLERVELCRECNHYMLTMDVRDRITTPDHRLAPLSLLHLDMVAQQKGYEPLTELPWNMPAQPA
ncbi:formate dehydrogenase accessory protein FdhE [Oceanidesulfovibrio marinus]|uniref:Formate dehydrogenase accessory protein FdhE n=1 Tax=Oceanidesulfovibrio marinus TaxID=370038 RepID=A0ABX6NG21_9BACT|nr:formate dehydrogenase accessory protein FdhE [Oceanidesulfovibrio marinus]QJT08993.1 formate dehydrogenase accessory protein FdhE [Oceanidesulfovibrio marinus]